MNKYIAKYDFDVAAKLKQHFQKNNLDESQQNFIKSALYEILDVCSYQMTKY